jgi:hypothetical protein
MVESGAAPCRDCKTTPEKEIKAFIFLAQYIKKISIVPLKMIVKWLFHSVEGSLPQNPKIAKSTNRRSALGFGRTVGCDGLPRTPALSPDKIRAGKAIQTSFALPSTRQK